MFVRARDIEEKNLLPVSSEICLNGPVVPLADGQNVSVSDHYGLLTEFVVVSS